MLHPFNLNLYKTVDLCRDGSGKLHTRGGAWACYLLIISERWGPVEMVLIETPTSSSI